MAIAIALLWIFFGLTVFTVAMRRSARDGRPQPLQDRTSTRIVTVIATVLVIFGVGVPTLVLAFNGSDRASVAPGGVTLTATEQHGRYLFSEVCSSCHTLAAANAVGRIGPDLDALQPPEALVLNAIEVGRARGNGNMPAMLYTGRDAEAVAEFVAATAGR